jgi:hypothetical protein
VQEGQVELGIVAPDLVPADLLEERVRLQLAPGPAVQDRLNAAGKGLEPEHDVLPPAEQGGERGELPAVVLGVVVRLA